MIWNPEIECADRERLHELQSVRLREMVGRIYEHVPAYRKKLQEKGIEPGDIRSVDQLKGLHLPPKLIFATTTRSDCLP